MLPPRQLPLQPVQQQQQRQQEPQQQAQVLLSAADAWGPPFVGSVLGRPAALTMRAAGAPTPHRGGAPHTIRQGPPEGRTHCGDPIRRAHRGAFRRAPLLQRQPRSRCYVLLLLLLFFLCPTQRGPQGGPLGVGPHWGAQAATSETGEGEDDVFIFEDPPEFASQEQQRQLQQQQQQQQKQQQQQMLVSPLHRYSSAVHGAPVAVLPAGGPQRVPSGSLELESLPLGPLPLRAPLQAVTPRGIGSAAENQSSSSSLSEFTAEHLAAHAAAAAASAGNAAATSAAPALSSSRAPAAPSPPVPSETGGPFDTSKDDGVPGDVEKSGEVEEGPEGAPLPRLFLPPLPVSRFAAAPGLQQTIEDAYDSLHLYTEALARVYLPVATTQGGPPGRAHIPQHQAVRPLYTEARGSEDAWRHETSGAATCGSSSNRHRGRSSSTTNPQQQQQQHPRQQEAVPLVADAWRRVNGRFLSVLPVVSVDGFLVSSGLRLPIFRSKPADSRKLPFATPYPGKL